MGFLDRLKDRSRGILTAAKPEDGVDPQPAEEVRRRLLAISGRGIEATDEGERMVVAWSAKVASAGPGGADYEFLYRAIQLELDEADHEVSGICLKTSTTAELDAGGLTAAKGWERGQHIGSETLHVLAWLGPHATGGAADEKGYKFAWSDLRDPVIDAVTSAGWTYRPKKV